MGKFSNKLYLYETYDHFGIVIITIKIMQNVKKPQNIKFSIFSMLEF